MESNCTPSVLSFIIGRLDDHDVATIVPAIDGTPLTELISLYERDHNLKPCGGYGGLVPAFFHYEPFHRYFLGDFDEGCYFAKLGKIYVLGCTCGEVGCWPLECRVRCEDEAIVWDRFEQPHRRARDYSAFGPFIFDSSQYRRAVADLEAQLSRFPA